jgi:hypothetical protein
MAYQVDRFNGTRLVAVEDGTIDTTTDLRFVGKNYAGYGEVQNENFLHLLENFANTTAPPRVISGQIWYDSANKKLKFYDGARFKLTGGAEVSTTAPAGLVAGEFWWDSSAKQLYTWSGTEFVLVGPEASPDLGSSGVTAQVVKDTTNTNHTIIRLNSGGKTVAIVSQTEFTLSSLNPIQDFTVIKKGFTLAKTNTNGESSDGYTYWGTASNSARLGGVLASQFVQKGSIVFDNEIRFLDPGFQVGDQNDLRVRIEGSQSDQAVIENRLGNDITFRITVTDGLDERDVLKIRNSSAVPGNDNSYTLGAAGLRWSEVYAVSFKGNLEGNVTGNTTGVHAGNVTAFDTQVLVNASTKELGFAGATLRGTLFGNVSGNLTGNADNSVKVGGFEPTITLPSITDKTSVPVRDNTGTVYAVRFSGTADRSDRTRINDAASDPVWNGADPSTQYRTAKTTKTPFTIAARDSGGNLLANIFDGTATAAQYADLAEKYLADQDYEVGTVVSVGGEAEITACNFGDRAIGVISANPAFMMNKDLEGGVYVALKGRVPVKVSGSVKKGDRLVASDNGRAVKATLHQFSDVFAIALESNVETENEVIEALVL